MHINVTVTQAYFCSRFWHFLPAYAFITLEISGLIYIKSYQSKKINSSANNTCWYNCTKYCKYQDGPKISKEVTL